ncbi:MAG: alpha-glucosidase, partial [Myxococcales bacterium]|nr:alpha-glucosidase [Myxococcales bacterium]
LPAAIDLGGFHVTVDRDARLDVRHADTGARSIFASPATGPSLQAARADLTVEDRQGSFTTHDQVEVACGGAHVDDARAAGGALVLRGGFDDDAAACHAVRWELQLCQARPGHLAFRLTTDDPSFDRLTLRVASDRDEHVYGAGEQFGHDTIDLKGRTIPVLAQEGGVGRGHTPITQAVDLASPGSGGSEASTYAASAHYLTSRLRSIFLEDTAYAELDFSRDDATELRLWAPAMTGRILAGDSPLALIERFTEYAGRMPPPPTWLDGGAILGLARDLPQSRALIAGLRARGAAIAAVWNQTWSGKVRTFIGEQVLWNWVANPAYHPDWNDFVDDLAADGIRTLCYVNPMLVAPPDGVTVTRDLFAEASAAGYFVRKPDGSPYLLRVTAFDVGLLDLTNPEARAWMKAVLQDELLDGAGCSGWMADFGEALPFDARLHSGEDAARYHDRYPVAWAQLNRDAVDEAGRLGDVVIFNRSGGTRTPGASLMMWEGDQLTTWDKYDGLVSALHGLLDAGMSGLSIDHSDTGGYTSLSLQGLVGYEREPELLRRWTEMNAFTAVLRTHEGNQPDVNAQVYSDAAAMDHFARFTRVYRSLAPYRRTLFDEAATHGWPVVRHLWLHYPDDPVAQRTDDEFLLGSEVLVAPVKNKCWTWPWCPYDKQVYLPRGRWIHLWSGKAYGSTGGGTQVTVKAPIGQPAVFYRRGSAMAAPWRARLRAEGI